MHDSAGAWTRQVRQECCNASPQCSEGGRLCRTLPIGLCCGVMKTTTYYPAAGAMRIDNDVYYVLKDHLGSASVVTDSSGNVVGEQRYYPFGGTRWSTGSLFTDKLFTGQREMEDLGIYHYGARFYSPTLGRFLSADTIISSIANPQTLNRYSYVANNPLKYTDPTGHKCNPDDGCETPHGDKGGSVPEPDLTKDGESFCKSPTQCYSGEGMQDLFNYYLQTPGWWNNNGTSAFTIEMFLGMMLMYELGEGVSGEDWLIMAATLQIWGDSTAAGGHGPYCYSTCQNGVFNFLAAYVQSAHKRYDLLIKGIDPTTGLPKDNYDPDKDRPVFPGPGPYSKEAFSKYFSEKAASIGSQVLNPNQEDTVYTQDKPYHWGNYTKVGNAQPYFSFGSFHVFSTAQHNAANAAGGSLILIP